MKTLDTKEGRIAGGLERWQARRRPFIHSSRRPIIRSGFWRFVFLVTVHLSIFTGREGRANPTGLTVATGTATAVQSGPQLTITASQNASLNWQTFNIAAGETTIFQQPSAQSVVWNHINDPNPSQIFGSLQANGIVVLMNSAGFYFGPNSYVKTGGLIVSTANCVPPQNSGGSWQFNGPPPAASIVNFGKIDVGQGGPAYLIAQNVLNFGSINAPGGDVGLAAGQQVLLSERPDGRGLSMKVNLPDGSVDNYGHITADAGTIALNARTVNQDGLVQANSVRNENGVIELVASDKLNLGANSRIFANGDSSEGGSSGGSVTLQSGKTFSDASGSRIDATGGSLGGNGGNVEISAPDILSLNSSVDASAAAGWIGGAFALDPVDIVLGTITSGPPDNNGTMDGTSGSGVFYVDVNNEFQNITAGHILLKASGNIYVGDGVVGSDGSFAPENGITWDLTSSAGGRISGNLSLLAGGDISFVDGSLITDANDWSVTLKAGVNNFGTGAVQPGVGNIYLNGGPGMGGSGSIQMGRGDGVSPAVSLVAGEDITTGSGYVITTGHGSILAHALAGSIDTGTDAQGYHFERAARSLDAAYDLSQGLGGISTEAGGDVTLIAGGNVSSFLPGAKIADDSGTAGAGAYGRTQNGDVTVVAGGNVTGHYLVANGTGRIFAGVQMDAQGNPVTDSSGHYVPGISGSAGTDPTNPNFALSLIRGGWNVTAAQDILLEEVRNPNGVFDYNGGSAYNHYFDYAADAYVNLSAGNMVQLGTSSSTLSRLKSSLDPFTTVPVIYPSILNITAGAGGVILGTRTSPASLVLFPSPQGSLTVDTPGSLFTGLNGIGGAPQLFNLIVSDAGHNQLTSTANFGANDHAASPIHADVSTPLYLNIGGDMNYINLTVPESAQINVGGSMINCGFSGMNVSADPGFQAQVLEADGSTRTVMVEPAVTRINVAGDLFNRGNFTSVDLSGIVGAQGLDLSFLAEASPTEGQLPGTTLSTSFFYDPATKSLTYEDIPNASLLDVLNQLNHLTYQINVNGIPQWNDPPDYTIPTTDTISVLGDPAQPGTMAAALLAQYKALSALPNPALQKAGYALPYNANTYGYTIGGGGKFDITARTIDLGTSTGIQSEGVAFYAVNGSYPLASLFGGGGVFGLNHGADISVTTTGNHSAGVNPHTGDTFGDVDMLSSSIGSLGGGNVSIHAGGAVNAGSPVLSVDPTALRGIYSTSRGDVSVIAEGDVNVSGSRIATYDGGNITVESLNGDVNVGTGASTPVAVTGYYEDSFYDGSTFQHAVYSDSVQLPFSGIVALTFPADASYPAPAILGNILVEAPNGNITANAAGILQIPLNHRDYPDATTTVLAGYELRDSSGGAVLADDSGKAVVEPLPVSAADLGNPARTAMVDGTKYQLSATVWAALLALLGSPGDSQVVNLHVIGDQTDFVAALLGDGSDLADSANYFSLVSAGRSINTSGSGIIASNARLDASGDITGLIFARNNIDIIAQQNINVTAFGVGHVNVSSTGGTVAGTLIGVGGVTASGGSVDASLISANVTGATSGQSGLGQGAAASAASQGLANNESAPAAAAAGQNAEDEKKRKGKPVTLAQKVSRVTVILPPKKMSETQNPRPGT